jgi:eukaryotic-like serine/threonine-protein kinase
VRLRENAPDCELFNEVNLKNDKEPICGVSFLPGGTVRVGAWNRSANGGWNQNEKNGVIPYEKWCFMSFALQQGSVETGSLRVTMDDKEYHLSSQMVDSHMEDACVVLGRRLKGKLGEVTMFHRFLLAGEIEAIRQRGSDKGSSAPIAEERAKPIADEKAGEGRLFAGHTEAVNSVTISGDGRRAASSSRDGTVRLWDVDTDKEVRRFDSGPAVSVAFFPDGRRVIAGVLNLHNFGGAVLWDADSSNEIRRFPMGRSWPRSMDLSADGRRAIMTGMWSTFVLWDVETGKPIRSFDSPGQIVTSVALSPDGRRALWGSDHETFLRLWDVEKGTVERIFKGHEAAIKSLTFSPDGGRALSGSEDGTLRLWDVSNGQELRQYKGHTGFVNSVAFTADGLRALSGGSDGTARLWDLNTGKELHCYTGHTGTVLSVAVSPDGRRALSGGEDKSMRLWDLPPAGQVRRIDGNTEPIWMVGFGQEGRRILSVSRDAVRQWDADTGKPAGAPWELAKYPTLAVVSPEGRHIVFSYGLQSVHLWDMEPRKVLSELFARGAYLSAVAYSGDGKRLIGGNHPLETEPAAVQVWDLSTGKQIRALEGHKQSVRTVALSRDGSLALSSGPDGVRLWDVEKGESRRNLDRPTVGALAFSPDGRRALLGDASGAVVLWDLETGKEASSFTGHKGSVNSVAFSPDGLRALSGGDDQSMRLWDATTGKELACFRGHTARVSSVAFSPDGLSAVSGSDDKTARLWSLPETVSPAEKANPEEKDAEIRRFEGHTETVFALAFTAYGKTLASAGKDNAVRLWDAATGKERAILEGHTGTVFAVAFSKDGTLLASSDIWGTVILWDVKGAKERFVISAHKGWAWAVAFSPDGKTFLSAGAHDATVRFWDVETGKEQFSIPQPGQIRTVALSPDGNLLAVTYVGGGVRLCEIAGRKGRRTLKNNGQDVNSVAFSPDGKIVATGGRDRTLRLWNVDKAELLLTFPQQRQPIESLAFSPDGKTIVTGGGAFENPALSGEIRIWDAATGKGRASFKGVGGCVHAVAFALDGKTFATGSIDGSIRLFQLPDPPTPDGAAPH